MEGTPDSEQFEVKLRYVARLTNGELSKSVDGIRNPLAGVTECNGDVSRTDKLNTQVRI